MSIERNFPTSGTAAMELSSCDTPSNDPDHSVISKLEAPSPLGTLSRLPRELRDEVYWWSFADENGSCRFTYLVSGWKLKDRSVSLLEVSSMTRQEALEALRTYGMFGFESYVFALFTELDEIPFVQYISHLTFFRDIYADGFNLRLSEDDPDSVEQYMSSIPAGPLIHFTGNEVSRNTCEMNLNFDTIVSVSSLLRSPMVEAMSQLTGFKAVTVNIIHLDDEDGGREAIMKTDYQQNAYRALIEDPHFSGFTALTTGMVVALEPTLGQCEASDIRCNKWDFSLKRSLVFHPLASIATKYADKESNMESESLCGILESPHSSPLGILSKLPRELRDQIFRLSLEDEYFYEPDEYRSLRGDKAIWKGGNLSLLRPSSLIRHEVLHALSVRSTFVFVINLEDIFVDGFECKRYAIPFIQSISNLCCNFDLNVYTWGSTRSWDEVSEEDIESATPGPLVHFTGNEILRNTCKLLFWFNRLNHTCELPAWPLLLFQSEFGGVIAQLTGFTTVILNLGLRLCKEDRMEEEASNRAASEGHRPPFAALTTRISTLLELSLGPSTSSDIHEINDTPGYYTLSRQITFQPQAFLSTKDAVKELSMEPDNAEVTLSRVDNASSPKPAAPPSSLGSLSRLPRELRDQIYHLIMDQPIDSCLFEFYGSDRRGYSSGKKWHRMCNSFLPVLRTSSLIRQEALEALTVWGKFEFRQDFWGPDVERQDIPFLENISNVRFEFDLNESMFLDGNSNDMLWPFYDTAVMPAGPLEAFTGGNIIRKSCVIKISNRTDRLPPVLIEPLKVTIARLTDFNSVTLDLRIFDEDNFYDVEGLGMTGYEGFSKDDKEAFHASTTSIAAQFESTLGPCVIGEVCDNESRYGLRRDVVFHPQAFLAPRAMEDESKPQADF